MLKEYFSQDTVHVPDIPEFFKFNINDKVRLDLSTMERKELNFKWSLNPGKKVFHSHPTYSSDSERILICEKSPRAKKLDHQPEVGSSSETLIFKDISL